MAVIAICVWTMASEINGTLKFADTWAQRGHRVVYVGIADARPLVQANGFEFVPVLECLLPQGSVHDDRVYYNSVRKSKLVQLAQAFERKRKFEQIIDYVLHDKSREIDSVFEELKPDLVIVGTHTPHTNIFAFIAARLKLRTVYLAQQMVQRKIGLQPDDKNSLVSMIRNWYRRFLFELSHVNYPKFYALFMKESGLGEYAFCSDLQFPLRIPVLYPWPPAFELPDVNDPQDLIRIESGVLLDRREKSESLLEFPRANKQVYCSFGHLLPLGLTATRRLLQTVIETARDLREMQFMIAVGPFFQVSDFDGLPPNVSLHQYVPQLRILSESDLVITHGGSSTIKECVLLGLPMIVIPLGYESHEYAHRVAFHGLGLRMDHAAVTNGSLRTAVLDLCGSERYKEAVRRMKSQVEDWENAVPSLGAIERCLASPNPFAMASA